MEGSNFLVVAPHPDDEILGSGGTLLKLNKLNKNIFIVILTNASIGAPELFTKAGTAKNREEAQVIHSLIGVQETIFLDFPAPRLSTYPGYKISNALSDIIYKNSIDTVFIPHFGDIHKDHQVAFEASLVACRPVNDNPVNSIYAYETISETEWSAPLQQFSFLPNIYIDIHEFIEQKIELFLKYRSEVKQFPHPRSEQGIRNLAAYRGQAMLMDYAETFMLIRKTYY